MDADQFDRLSRTASARLSRRGLSVVTAATLAMIGAGDASAKRKKRKR